MKEARGPARGHAQKSARKHEKHDKSRKGGGKLARTDRKQRFETQGGKKKKRR
jgi:hypothetical protein